MGKQNARPGLQFAASAGSGFITQANGMTTTRKQH
jgi:hypothetical protein